jgi:AN1-like Zinc finger.
MEFTSLGKHCYLCKQKDYLPIKCSYCHKYFCKEHFTPDDHNCNDKLDNKKKIATKIKFRDKCCVCKVKLSHIHCHRCKICNKKTCIKHIFHDDHKNSK